MRRPHDPVESAHFADLTAAAAEALAAAGSTPVTRDLVELTRALRANVFRIRNKPDEAGRLFGKIDAKEIADHWARGRALTLHASYLDRYGQPEEALATRFSASAAFKRADDELERIRCVADRTTAWLARGVSPCKLMTLCIQRLEPFNFPAASLVHETAHLNRLFGGLYVEDRLTGDLNDKLAKWRSDFPEPCSSEAVQADLLQVDGLLAHFQKDDGAAVVKLEEAAGWFDTHDMPADTTVAYLQRALCTLESDPEKAREDIGRACDYLKKTRFRALSLHLFADVLREPTYENVRELILAVVRATRQRPRRPKST